MRTTIGHACWKAHDNACRDTQGTEWSLGAIHIPLKSGDHIAEVLRLTRQMGGVHDRVILQPQLRCAFFLSHTSALARSPVRAAAITGAPTPVGRTIFAVGDYSE